MAKQLFRRRLLLVTGKGGVGKTTIAAGLAVAARDRGLNVLLVQLGKIDNIGPIFGKRIPPYKFVELEHRLTAFSIEPYLALHEYLVNQVKVQFVVDMFLENRVIQYLTQAAPGWRELITVGKIWQIQNQTLGYRKRPRFDLIVVDAPATGHGISFLRVPAIILNTIRFGPIRRHTLEVQKLLLDPDRTLLVGVALPEEMPVNEVAEIHKAARSMLHIPYGGTVLNAFTTPAADRETAPLLRKLLADKKAMALVDKTVPGGAKPLLDALDTRGARAALSERYLAEIAARIGGDVFLVPMLPQARLDRESIAKVARVLDDQVEDISQ
ncbi:MAG: ArsA family ATPase [Candidatus Lernaella stagnicola]|nr:ArsA family ATPase [Candidatus Lernaella stagnicola]